MMNRSHLEAVGLQMSADPDSFESPFGFLRTPTQTSLKSTDLPPGRWETQLHGSCPTCHHFHVSVPLTISRLPGIYSGIRCRKCGHKWFGLGGASVHSSLASQETIQLEVPLPSSSGGQATQPDEPSCEEPIAQLVRSMHSMSAMGSPPLMVATATTETHRFPISQQRPRTASQVTAIFRPKAPVSPMSPIRIDDGLLSPLDAAIRNSSPHSAPTSPVTGPGRFEANLSLPFNRSRSLKLKNRVKGVLNKAAGKFGYEFKKIDATLPVLPSQPMQVEVPGLTHEVRDISDDTETKDIIAVDPSNGLSSITHTVPIALGIVAETRPTPSGRIHLSPLEIQRKRRHRSQEVNSAFKSRKLHNDETMEPYNVPLFSHSTASTGSGGLSEPTTPERPPPRESLEFSYMDHDDYERPRGQETSATNPFHYGPDAKRLSRTDTVSLHSGAPSPNDPNLRELYNDVQRIWANSHQQHDFGSPSLSVNTSTEVIHTPSEPHRDGDRTPTNDYRDL